MAQAHNYCVRTASGLYVFKWSGGHMTYWLIPGTETET